MKSHLNIGDRVFYHTPNSIEEYAVGQVADEGSRKDSVLIIDIKSSSTIEISIDKILKTSSNHHISVDKVYELKYRITKARFGYGYGWVNPNKLHSDMVDIVCHAGGVTYQKIKDVIFLRQIY